jgi:Fe-S-cluster containining protein
MMPAAPNGELHFGCTLCGKCCRDSKLPLTVAEAVQWLTDGNPVQVLCEAQPWPQEPPPEDLQAAHRRRRSFAGMSGSLPARVVVILASDNRGACPNLQPDLHCGIYARRPLVCRIYPAEVNPFIALRPEHKMCPPEAWSDDRPLFQRGNALESDDIRGNVLRSRAADAADTAVKQRLCEALSLDCAALAAEGFVVYSPPPAALLAALQSATAADLPATGGAGRIDWCFISNQCTTVRALTAAGGRSAFAGSSHAGSSLTGSSQTGPSLAGSFEYLGLKPAAPTA